MPHTDMIMGDDGILRVAFIGDTGKEGAQAFIKALEPFLQAAPETEPLCAIIDATRPGKGIVIIFFDQVEAKFIWLRRQYVDDPFSHGI